MKKSQSKPLSQRAYAKLRGVSHTAVRRAIAEGRLDTSLITDENGHRKIISAELADVEWASTTAPSMKEREADEQAQRELGDHDVSYKEARRRREIETLKVAKIQAEHQRLDLAERSGDLLSAERVNGELLALLAVSSKEPFWHAAVLLGCDAGLRMGELRGLRWSDWNKREGRLHIQRSADKETNEMGPTKGWGRRKIPLTGRLAAALRAIRRPCELVLCDADTKMLSYEKFRWNLPRLLRAAEVAPGTWHDMRHTFCSHLAMKGAPAKVIQELAGHTELSTTLKYMHLTEGAREDAIALLDTPFVQRSGLGSG